jgi:uncharacterized C2H2 Zn-finger protein
MNVQCPNCPMRFPMTSVLKYHQEKAHQSKDIICNICGKAVKANRMKAHISKIHTLEKKLQCDKCDYRTNDKSDFNRHMMKKVSLVTVFDIILYTPSFLLKIKVIIKISFHPWYPINYD